MPQIIQSWLTNRLGIVLDLSFNNFGKNVKDGVLLARLLYSYGVLPIHVLELIKETKNYHECLRNLNLLKPWLEHIGVSHNNTLLEEIAGGEGSSAITLFYSVYNNLEKNDRLNYIFLQKQRKFSDNNCKGKFKISRVSDLPQKNNLGDSLTGNVSLSAEKTELIEWHKAKCKEVIENIKKIKEKFSKNFGGKKLELRPIVSRHTSSQVITKNQLEAEELRKTIESFEKKHVQKCPNLTYSELINLKNVFEEQLITMDVPNPEKVKNVLCKIKAKKKREMYAKNFQESMQEKVLEDQWNNVIKNQNECFDKTVCKTLLKQSQYEKQMAGKLHQLRNKKKNIAENRKLIENLKTEQRDFDFDNLLATKMEKKIENMEEEKFEKERLLQLHKNVYEEKVRARKEFLKMESHSIIESIIEIALRVVEIRELTTCQVPKALMKDWKELFYKNLSIFDSLDHLEELCDAELELSGNNKNDEGKDNSSFITSHSDQVRCQEKCKHNILNEADFVDYMKLLGPWMVELLLPDSTETEVQQFVLGYVVHKLLNIKYPVLNRLVHAPLKPMKPTAIIQDLDDDGCKMLMDLMNPCKILVVLVNDAINFVLSTYKQELSSVRDIDITFQNLTEKALQDKPGLEKDKDMKKKMELLKKEEEDDVEILNEDFILLNKETQTPRKIPDDDPLLSPNAEIGKIVFEFLGAGDPVPDNALTSAISAYVYSKQEDYDGWILLNYPQFYSQASDLEYILTGYRFLPVDEFEETLEEIEGFSYRQSCSSNMCFPQEFAKNQSRLVPKPNTDEPTPESTPKSYFDYFIKLKKTSDLPKTFLEDISCVTPIEEFYFNQRILRYHEYSKLNFQTVKNIGKLILCKNFEENSLMAKTSFEVFGDTIFELNEKWDPTKKKNVKQQEKETVGESRKLKEKEATLSEYTDFEIELKDVNYGGDFKTTGKKSADVPNNAKPGDPEWEWVSGNQPEELLLALATLWENMEAIYIEDLKDVFFGLRIQRCNLLSYCGFIHKSVEVVMKQPDEKQKVLGDFQQMFNDIDEDLRPDLDIKCELHIRVSELEEALMGLADERKAKSLKDVTKVAQDCWAADEMANLINLFLTIVQLEVDRCLETCQILTDYYTSLQQKIPDEKIIGKVIVSKLQVKDRKYSIVSSSTHKSSSGQFATPRNTEVKKLNRTNTDQSNKTNFERSSKTRGFPDKKKKNSDVNFLAGASENISDILVNLALPSDGNTLFHNFFRESVSAAKNETCAIMEGILSDIRKSDKNNARNGKKGGDAGPTPNGNLIAEWETALCSELSRFNFRMKLILARGMYDLNEFLATILNTLSALADDVHDMYLREVQSITECCKVFRCSIEEEIPVQPQLELREDCFFVNQNVLFFTKRGDPPSVKFDKQQEFRFAIEHLHLIFDKLRRVAPNGEIIKRSLLFILEDLRAFNSEIKNCDCFPRAWKNLDPNDIITILDEIYLDLEIVNWKDFIIYGFEIPPPTEEDVLNMRKLFRECDCSGTELITRENYDKIKYWFEENKRDIHLFERHEKIKDLLFKMYQVDELQANYSALMLAFCKDENPFHGFTKALALIMGKKIKINEFPEENYLHVYGESDEYENDDVFENYPSNFLDNQNNDSSSSSDSYKKCLPKQKNLRCTCTDDKSVNPDDDDVNTFEGSYSEEGESRSLFYDGPNKFSLASETTTVPSFVLSLLLKTSFPSLSQLSALLDCNQIFQDTINSVYDSLEPSVDQIYIYKLLRHKFIYQLLQSTNKFKHLRTSQILMSLLKSKGTLSASFCYLHKSKINCREN
ncbi:hypothetical protein Phum_PHUM496580 [Pediculus humanus corporis]|uniref:Calponin-homology (CH) domain-containing protein n=1 Tax=Pediculus humanus subsp. corporis TaxID=121224 RepID=E0VX84_PEDHC|nr:uncharacterized protein Phum_PHUM496580 [Pediculus humanus corporis]EEB17990.1 hypothetical protein Phum_PHUM496580 [Pediculus humanus corporis]